MPDITDGAILAALGRQLNHAVARQTVAASNLANLDTPGYRTRDVSFDDALDGELMQRTHASHLPAAGQAGQADEASGLQSRRG